MKKLKDLIYLYSSTVFPNFIYCFFIRRGIRGRIRSIWFQVWNKDLDRREQEVLGQGSFLMLGFEVKVDMNW